MDVNLQFKRYDVAKAAAKAIIDNPDNNFSLYYSGSTILASLYTYLFFENGRLVAFE